MGTVTIGVSIAVPEPHGSLLQQLRTGFGDAAAHGIPTHVTLLPPTEVDGASLPETLVERAVELGYSALALLDRDGVYGIPRFHLAAKRAGAEPGEADSGRDQDDQGDPDARGASDVLGTLGSFGNRHVFASRD